VERKDPVALLVDPISASYETAARDLGFGVLPLLTGLSKAANRRADPDDEMTLRIIDANDVDGAVRQVRATGLDVRAVVPASGTSLHVADAIAARLGLPGNDPALGWARRNKVAMRARAAEAGVRIPEFRLVRSPEGVAEAARDMGFPVIVKQTMGTGSYGISVISDAAALDDPDKVWTIDWLGRPTAEWLVERYIRGREYAVNFFSADGVHRMVDIWEYRQPDDRDYDFPLWDIIQIGADHPDYARVEQFVQQALDGFGIRQGPSHIEVKCESGGDNVYLIELAARFSGGPAVGLWPRYSDLRPYHDAVECFLGRCPNVIDGDHGFTAVLGSVVFRNDGPPGTLVAVHGLDELAALPGVADVLAGFQPGERVPTTQYNMIIPVSASVHGPDRATVLRTIAVARETVRLEIAPDPAGPGNRAAMLPGAVSAG